MCDAAYMMNNVEAKWPGSTLSDTFAFGEFIYSKAKSYDQYFVSSYCNWNIKLYLLWS